jgi:hypothetical protein
MTGLGTLRRAGLVHGSVFTIWKEKMEEMRKYPDDAYLMDIYSFPEYQVEVEVVTISNDPSTPVTRDEALKDVADPVALRNLGISV